MTSVWFEGVDELNKVAIDLHGAGLRAQLGARRAVAKTALEIEATAKSLAPVDTGALRNSISSDITDGRYAAEIGPTVEYAPYVEYGTSRMAPQAYMGPALDRHGGEFAETLSVLAGRSVWP